MAHFAKVEDGKVNQVIVVNDEDCGNLEFPSSELVGQNFISSLGFDGDWVQTSYEKVFRGQYAGIGMNWNGTCFYPDCPFEGLILNDSTGEWSPPE